MKYTINLIRSLREKEYREAVARRRGTLLITLCAVLLAVALAYSAWNTVDMLRVIELEREKLARVEAEYRQYQSTTMIVDKGDIELLDKLQNDRIFWTRKLASMALHLPENYWVTRFGYGKGNQFDVDGYGYISRDQKQLITLDDYLNLLRGDTLFNDVFRNVHLEQARRDDEGTRERVSFRFSAGTRRARR